MPASVISYPSRLSASTYWHSVLACKCSGWLLSEMPLPKLPAGPRRSELPRFGVGSTFTAPLQTVPFALSLRGSLVRLVTGLKGCLPPGSTYLRKWLASGPLVHMAAKGGCLSLLSSARAVGSSSTLFLSPGLWFSLSPPSFSLFCRRTQSCGRFLPSALLTPPGSVVSPVLAFASSPVQDQAELFR